MADTQTVEPRNRQPSKAEMEESIVIDANLDELGTAITRGGAAPRPETKPPKQSPS